MKRPNWIQADSRKAKQIWEEYQKRNTEGLNSPLFFQRVSSETYFRKGGRR